jgi:hypothetical protein
MKKTTITKQDILFFTISLFIVTAAWIGFGIYHSVVTSTISTTLQTQIIPISGRFDTTTLARLKNRTHVIPQATFVGPSIAEKENEPTPVASSSSEAQSLPAITGQP